MFSGTRNIFNPSESNMRYPAGPGSQSAQKQSLLFRKGAKNQSVASRTSFITVQQASSKKYTSRGPELDAYNSSPLRTTNEGLHPSSSQKKHDGVD